MKFKIKEINVSKNPVIIVGQNPGRQRKSEQTYTAWEGNRSADLLKWTLGNNDNILLTNVTNYQDITNKTLDEGLKDLVKLVSEREPKKIICLGQFSERHVRQVINDKVIVSLKHPSFIARFNKDRDAYKNQIIESLK